MALLLRRLPSTLPVAPSSFMMRVSKNKPRICSGHAPEYGWLKTIARHVIEKRTPQLTPRPDSYRRVWSHRIGGDQQPPMSDRAFENDAQLVIAVPIIDGPDHRLEFGRQTIEIHCADIRWNDLSPSSQSKLEAVGNCRTHGFLISEGFPVWINRPSMRPQAGPIRRFQKDGHRIEWRTDPDRGRRNCRERKYLTSAGQLLLSLAPRVCDEDVRRTRDRTVARTLADGFSTASCSGKTQKVHSFSK